MKIFSTTHRGLIREINEDRFLVKDFGNETALLVVADGLGGHAAGELAAQIATEGFGAFDPKATAMDVHLTQLVQAINRRILDVATSDSDFDGMGTTLTATFLSDFTVHWIHVGDSRLYLFREEVLVQVTDDHTVAGLLLRAGEMSGEEAMVHPTRSMLMSCLGRVEFETDGGVFELKTGDLLMLSTDGLHDRVPEGQIVSALGKQVTLPEKANDLIGLALSAGGRDNITVVLAQI